VAMRRLLVAPIRCKAHGYCAELFPERVHLDDWGYPIVDPTPFGDDLLAEARRTVSQCPVLALSTVAIRDHGNLPTAVTAPQSDRPAP
jgi:ferredoxin